MRLEDWTLEDQNIKAKFHATAQGRKGNNVFMAPCELRLKQNSTGDYRQTP